MNIHLSKYFVTHIYKVYSQKPTVAYFIRLSSISFVLNIYLKTWHVITFNHFKYFDPDSYFDHFSRLSLRSIISVLWFSMMIIRILYQWRTFRLIISVLWKSMMIYQCWSIRLIISLLWSLTFWCWT